MKVVRRGSWVIALGAVSALLPLAPLTGQNLPTVHLLLSGRVELQRVSWGKFQVVGPLLWLSPNDRLRSQEKGRLLCSNLIPQEFTAPEPATVEDLCSNSDGNFLRRGNSLLIESRSNRDDRLELHIPYILAPLKTKVLSRQPLFHWQDVGAQHYQVTIFGSGVRWNATTTDTKLRYEGEVLPLLEGGRYGITVCAVNIDNTEVCTSKENPLEFQVAPTNEVPSAEVEETRAAATQLESLNLTGEEKVLALATLYAARDLDIEAVAILKEAEPTLAVSRELGNSYSQAGLHRLALKEYQAASVEDPQEFLSAAQFQDDTEEIQKEIFQLEVWTRLGITLKILEERETARVHLQAAKVGYEKLTDVAAVERLQRELDNLDE